MGTRYDANCCQPLVTGQSPGPGPGARQMWKRERCYKCHDVQHRSCRSFSMSRMAKHHCTDRTQWLRGWKGFCKTRDNGDIMDWTCGEKLNVKVQPNIKNIAQFGYMYCDGSLIQDIAESLCSCQTDHLFSYLIFVISFTQAAFSNFKFYTQKLTKNTQKHWKMSLKSKIYAVFVFNLKNFTPDSIFLHGHRPWCP